MKYMMLIYWNHHDTPDITPEEQQELRKSWFNFNKEAKAAGVLLDYNGLLDATDATTVRVRDGKTLITDGPFAETHEQLGGYYVLDCKDLDEAISWAAKIPAAIAGSIEIRPMYMAGQG